jgi:FixJ family two-component response regulator
MGGQTCSMSGMVKRYIVNLTRAERESLEQLVKRDRVSGAKRQRASILLKADDDLTDQEIAEELEVGVRTVARVRQRCVDRGGGGEPGAKGPRQPLSTQEARWCVGGAIGAARM